MSISIPSRKSKIDSVAIDVDVGTDEVDKAVEGVVGSAPNDTPEDEESWSSHSYASDVDDSGSLDSGVIVDLTAGSRSEVMQGLILDVEDESIGRCDERKCPSLGITGYSRCDQRGYPNHNVRDQDFCHFDRHWETECFRDVPWNGRPDDCPPHGFHDEQRHFPQDSEYRRWNSQPIFLNNSGPLQQNDGNHVRGNGLGTAATTTVVNVCRCIGMSMVMGTSLEIVGNRRANTLEGDLPINGI